MLARQSSVATMKRIEALAKKHLAPQRFEKWRSDVKSRKSKDTTKTPEI